MNVVFVKDLVLFMSVGVRIFQKATVIAMVTSWTH